MMKKADIADAYLHDLFPQLFDESFIFNQDVVKHLRKLLVFLFFFFDRYEISYVKNKFMSTYNEWLVLYLCFQLRRNY